VPMTATSYTVAALQVATNSFSQDSLLGEGSLGRVYKAEFPNGKVKNSCICKYHLALLFLTLILSEKNVKFDISCLHLFIFCLSFGMFFSFRRTSGSNVIFSKQISYKAKQMKI
jgi:hypothetical protein